MVWMLGPFVNVYCNSHLFVSKPFLYSPHAGLFLQDFTVYLNAKALDSYLHHLYFYISSGKYPFLANIQRRLFVAVGVQRFIASL